ncbi:IclR family transcriptional regulator [Streptomyces milbemycinicus]|uniref:IclR family transcriptional regulator n=1 Tax=Streptomyces milbemycinicus TaxID=476552 RepID=A0ABW8M375_9ACTN
MTTAAVPRGQGEEARPDGRSPKSVLGKVGLILSAFGDGDLSLSLTELTARTGVAKATVHRLLQELVDCGLLERDGSDYRLGLQLYAIGLRAPRQRTLRQAARPVLENLAQTLDSPVTLSVPHGSELLCIDNVGRHRNRAGAPVGGRLLQLHSTAPGKLTLALLPEQYPLAPLAPRMRRMTAHTFTAERLPRELARIREQGYATEVEEHRLGYFAVAVPVCGPRDAAYLGALSVVATTAHGSAPRTLAALRNASKAVTARLSAVEAYRTEP